MTDADERYSLYSFKSEFMKTSTLVYLDKDEKPSPWATSMVIQVRDTRRICILRLTPRILVRVKRYPDAPLNGTLRRRGPRFVL